MENNSTDETGAHERIVCSTKRHWAIMFPPFFLLIFAGLNIPSKQGQAWVLVAISLAWIAVSWANFQTAYFRLTKSRLLVKVGFPFPKTHDIPLENIRGANVYQPVLGKFLDFGKLRIMCADGSRKFFKMVSAPHQMAAAIYECKAAMEEGAKAETPG